MRLARRGDGGIRILRATTTCCGDLVQSDSHIKLFPDISPRFSPANDIEKVKYKLIGRYKDEDIILERHGRKFVASIGNEYFTNMKDACRYLEFSTKDRSAPRILYNLAVRNKFEAA